MKGFLKIPLVLLLCLSLLSPIVVHADNGEVTGEKSDAFDFLGYSFCEYADGFSLNYRVNSDFFENYEKQTGKKLEYGIVAASKSELNGLLPLVTSSGDVTSDKVKKSILSAGDIFISASDLNLDNELYLCGYIYDGQDVKYLSGNEISHTPTAVLYSSLKAEIPNHTKQVYDKTIKSYTINGVNFSTKMPLSTIANDRQKQYNNSMADYGKGSGYTESELDKAESGTSAITNILTSIIFPNASSFMKHFLSNTGDDYIIDMGTGSKGFFKSSDTKNHRITRVDQALRAAEALACEGVSIDIFQTTEQVNHFSDNKEDWYLSVGSYFTCITMTDLTLTIGEDGIKTYACNLIYEVTDFYNWNENDGSTVSILSISPKDLHNLHKAGRAKEFNSHGTATYKLTWTEGQSASTLSFK